MNDKILRSAQDAVRNADLTGPEEHRHIWEYDQESQMYVCRICRASRMPYPGEIEMVTAKELRIRHDGEESDL